MPTLQDYLDLIIPEHQDDPDFIAFVSIFLQGQVDNQSILAEIPGRFALETARGWWLDQVGARLGQSRNIDVPLTGVYFSWGSDGPGWGSGVWLSPGDDTTGLAVLPDEPYRTLLYAIIARNKWDGTVPGAYAVWDVAFGPNQIAIDDFQDGSMAIIWIGATLTAVEKTLLTTGKLDLRPAGIGITGYFEKSIQDAPIFGWGEIGVGGWGIGAWLQPVGFQQVMGAKSLIFYDGTNYYEVTLFYREMQIAMISAAVPSPAIIVEDSNSPGTYYQLAVVDGQMLPQITLTPGPLTIPLVDSGTNLTETLSIFAGELEVNP